MGSSLFVLYEGAQTNTSQEGKVLVVDVWRVELILAHDGRVHLSNVAHLLSTQLALVRVRMRGSFLEVCWWGHDDPFITCGEHLPIIATFLRRAARIAATPPSLPLLLPLPACTLIKKKTSEQME